MFTKEFWLEASERALKTFAQTLLAMAGAVSVFDAFSADWLTLLGVSLGAAVLSYATSIVSAEIGDYGKPSLVARKPDLDEAPVDEPEGDEDA
jgi:hypothetical protein